MASTFAAAARAMDDWIAGPAALLDEVWRSAPGTALSATVSGDGQTLMVSPSGGRKPAAPVTISLAADRDAKVQSNLSALAKGKAVVLNIPGSWVIARKIELPIEAASHVDGIVTTRISALSPLGPSDIYYGHRILSASREAKQLTVAVAIVPKARVAAALESLAGAEARQVDIAAPFPDADSVAVMTRRASTTGARGRIKFAIAAILGLCVVSSTLALAGRPYLTEAYAERRAALEVRAEKARSAIAAATAPEKAATPPEQEALGIKDDAISALGALDDLAAALPLHSYATEVSFAEGRMRLSGRTQDVPEVLTALESSGRFVESKLVGPALRSEDGATSEFEVDTRPLIRNGGALR